MKVAKELEVMDISDGMDIKNEEKTFDDEIIADNEFAETVNEENSIETSKRKVRQPRSQIPDTKSTECPECQAVYSSRRDLQRHYRSKHEGIKYPCNQCNYQATQKGDLKKHTQRKHY